MQAFLPAISVQLGRNSSRLKERFKMGSTHSDVEDNLSRKGTAVEGLLPRSKFSLQIVLFTNFSILLYRKKGKKEDELI